ncbi:uncharacterized protein (DUF305 family) [Actimicrobium sp. GrIS 1.19]|uniref:DUF305 domain-containing protein n=1 Tax=Actimicrobium sp. GrIS 1.19 TaxID=3071708 RepID=UPI002E0C8371|nr:uncharacterized protein (DUF305 family) [Actimicrobium sp. GrIS 1.19]
MPKQADTPRNGRIVRNLTCAIAIALSLSVLPFSAGAQSSPAVPAKMGMDKDASTDAPMKMHQSMGDMQAKTSAMKMTGDADTDFAMMMVAHHQGAIDIAQAEIDGGKDPAMIGMAKKIITAQKKEIAQFEAWLKKHPHAMK